MFPISFQSSHLSKTLQLLSGATKDDRPSMSSVMQAL
jgi:hypothetical protein